MSVKPWLRFPDDRAMQYKLKGFMRLEFALYSRIRTSFAQQSKGGVTQKIGSLAEIESFLGYPMTDLKLHLERQFTRYMSWETFGDIHIDHITPLSAFNLKKTRQAKAAWALSNLRPLWQEDDRRKGPEQFELL